MPKDSDSSSCSGSGCSSPLSPGAVAGIAIAVLVGVVILVGVLFFFIRRQRQKAAYKATPPEPDVSFLSGPGPVQNAGPSSPSRTDQSPLQARFWSPDAVHGDACESHNSKSRHDGVSTDNSVDEHGLELDGHDTQIKPVYHELPGSEVWRTGPGPGSVVQ